MIVKKCTVANGTLVSQLLDEGMVENYMYQRNIMINY